MNRRLICLLMIGALLIASVHIPVRTHAETIAHAPLVEQSTPTDGMIRVWLSSIRGKAAYNLTVSGSYTLDGASLSNGSKVKVEFSGGTVYVTSGGTRKAMGSSVTLKRQSGGVKIAESLAPGNLYPGDMRFFYSNGTAYMVCSLYVEDYIYGVLPYEMDNSFPLEALKAQAVTARTYAMRAKTTSGAYDVTDTTTHQVFRGVNASKTRCIQAVDDTWGIVIKYNGAYAGAYYSASNGGQTEAANHAWGGSAVNYLIVKEDSFDLANTSAVKKSYMIYATPQLGSSVSAYAQIQSALASKHGGTAGGYTINEITDVVLHTPMYAAPSKLYTRMQVSVKYNGGSSSAVDIPIFPTLEKALNLNINNLNNELYTVEKEEKGFRIVARRYGHGVGMSQRGAEQMGEMGYSYAQILGFYFPGVERVRMNLISALASVSPTPAPKEEVVGTRVESPGIVSLDKPDDRLNLRGEANASSTILARIPNGTEIIILSEKDDWYKVRYGLMTGYVSRAYVEHQSMAGSQPSEQASAAAVVTLDNPKETLNLRMAPSDTAPILARLLHDTPLTVLETGEKWAKVSYLDMTGYVMNQFITLQAGSAPMPQENAATAQPAASPSRTYRAVVSVAGGSLNLRSQPNKRADVLDKLPSRASVEVTQLGDEWCGVRYGDQAGYTLREYLIIEGVDTPPTETMVAAPAETATPESEPAVWTPVAPEDSVAWVATSDGDRLNLRRSASSTATVLVRVPHGSEVRLLELGERWTKVSYGEYKGYVSTQYLTSTRPAVSAGSLQAEARPDGAAWINSGSTNSVNLRRMAAKSSDAVALMPPGSEVTVLESGEDWTKVIYRGLTGYVMNEYVAYAPPAVQPATPTAQPTEVVSTPEAARSGDVAVAAASPVIVGDAQTTILNAGKAVLNSPTATLHLHSQPEHLSSETGSLKQGATVEVLQYYRSDSIWLYVRGGSAQGYALAEHFSLDNALATVSLRDAGSSLSVRKSGDASAQVVGSLAHGAVVTLLSTDSGWARVRLGDGTVGYVLADYLSRM